MTPPTDLELQQWLAEQLPNELKYRGGRWFERNDTRTAVTDWEWLHIVSLVEAKLTKEQQNVYVGIMFACRTDITCAETFRTALCATWQQRAIALRATLTT